MAFKCKRAFVEYLMSEDTPQILQYIEEQKDVVLSRRGGKAVLRWVARKKEAQFLTCISKVKFPFEWKCYLCKHVLRENDPGWIHVVWMWLGQNNYGNPFVYEVVLSSKCNEAMKQLKEDIGVKSFVTSLRGKIEDSRLVFLLCHSMDNDYIHEALHNFPPDLHHMALAAFIETRNLVWINKFDQNGMLHRAAVTAALMKCQYRRKKNTHLNFTQVNQNVLKRIIKYKRNQDFEKLLQGNPAIIWEDNSKDHFITLSTQYAQEYSNTTVLELIKKLTVT